ncbi:MAG TPA: sulfotransferase [Nocardioides sp.]|nr:sulfotransferase [Nocardioides sp.]
MAGSKSARLPWRPGSRAADLEEQLEKKSEALREARRELRRTRRRLEGAKARMRKQRRKQRARVESLRERLRKERVRTDLGYVFICTYGRSGSTLLQGVLNSIPGYQIRGENRQALWHLYEMHQLLMRQKRSHSGRIERDEPLPVTHPFYGVDGYPVSAHRSYRRLALELLLRPDHDTRVTGFKEIRWADEDVVGYVRFLRNVFPEARFVINTRDLDAVSASAWWARDPDARTKLEEAEARLDALAEELGSAAYRVRYDDYVADPAALTGLFEWLGEELDLDVVRSVLDVEHSYQPKDQPEDASEDS